MRRALRDSPAVAVTAADKELEFWDVICPAL